MKKILILTHAASLLLSLASYAQTQFQPEEPSMTLISLVNEQREAIERVAHKYEEIFNAFGDHDHPQYDDMAQVAFGLSFYPEMLEGGISHQERISSDYWKLLLAFLSEYEAGSSSEYAHEKRYIRLLTEYVLDLCEQARGSTKR